MHPIKRNKEVKCQRANTGPEKPALWLGQNGTLLTCFTDISVHQCFEYPGQKPIQQQGNVGNAANRDEIPTTLKTVEDYIRDPGNG